MRADQLHSMPSMCQVGRETGAAPGPVLVYHDHYPAQWGTAKHLVRTICSVPGQFVRSAVTSADRDDHSVPVPGQHLVSDDMMAKSDSYSRRSKGLDLLSHQ